jgi:glycosyltransferase involved in cell wall biosynthesis/tetratricopeptide (TPR) repeat protein
MALRDIFYATQGMLRLPGIHEKAGGYIVESACRAVLSWRPRQKAALAGLGRLLLLGRHFEEAIDVWQRAVEVEPAGRGPAFQLARALHRSGRLEAAAGQYLRVLELDPEHEKAVEALQQLADRVAPRGQSAAPLQEAMMALALRLSALDSGPGRLRRQGLALQARIQARTDPEAAIACWTELAQMQPAAIDPPLQMARLRARQRDHTEALALFRAVLERDPDHREALAGYGHALAGLDRPTAIEHFRRWADRQSRDPAPLLELAKLHQQSGEWEKAGTVYDEILGRVSGDKATLSRLAQLVSRDSRHTDHALELWARLAERDAAAPFPLVQRAYLLERARRVDEAETEYRAALQRAPKDAMSLMGLARLLVGKSHWEEAARLFEVLHRVDPRRADTLLGLGRCLERLDRAEEALAAFQKVLAHDPANANALLYRGRLLRALGRIDEAIEAWRQACARAPGNADAWYELVFMLATAERDGEALAALDAAEKALPATAASWARLGLAAQAGLLRERAVAYFRRAIAAEPGNPGHWARLGQLYLREGVIDGAFQHLLTSRELKPDDAAVAKQLVNTVHTLNIVGVDHLRLANAPRCGEVLVPERLFEQVRRVVDAGVPGYEPVPRRVIAVSASLAGGGAERQLVNLLRGLSERRLGLELTLFCVSLARRTRRDFFLPLLAGTPVEVLAVPDAALEASLATPEAGPYADLVRAFPNDMAGSIAFWLVEFRRRRPQVVHAWQDSTALTAAVAALLAGVPRIVLAARSVRPDNPRRRLKRFMHSAYQAVLGHPSVVLTNNSRAGADDYAEWLGLDLAAVRVVYNGIDFDQLECSVDPTRVRDLRKSLGIPGRAPLIGSAFRMSEEKRPLLWVEVAAEVARQEPTAHFIVYGDGPMRSEMVELARRLGIAERIHFPGAEDDIASCYKAMDTIMLTSRHEGLPNVLLEAQALGVPVVAPDVGGVAETILQGVTGFAVRDADAAALASRVLYCLRETAWRERARAAGPPFVRERFGVTAMLERTLEIYGLGGIVRTQRSC